MWELLTLFAMFLGAFVTALVGVSFAWAWRQVHRPQPDIAPEHDEAAGSLLLKEENISTIALWGRLLVRFSHIHLLRCHIEEANLSWSAGRATAAMLLIGTLVFVLLDKLPWLPLPIGLLIAGLCASLPYGYILSRRARRFAAFATQFPDALDSLSRALKAGFPISAGFEMLAQEFPEPLAQEMRRTRDEWKLGVSWDTALDKLALRLPIPEVRLFVSAVKMQNRMGGRLNDVLAKLAETMRDAVALDSEVRSISAHSRITGMVLTVMPLAIGSIMLLVNPEYIARLFQRPEGRMLLSAAAISNVAAHFLIRHLSRVRL